MAKITINPNVVGPMTRVIQRGVQFPDDSIIWGDPSTNNVVQISYLGDARNSTGMYYLDENRGAGAAFQVQALMERYAKRLADTGIDPESTGLRIVERELTLIIGDPSVVE